jgi:hypothetical protein
MVDEARAGGCPAAACATGGGTAAPVVDCHCGHAGARTATSPPTPQPPGRCLNWSRRRACAGTARRPHPTALRYLGASVFWERTDGPDISIAAAH